ncbi:MAG TPA: uroporphyrinogen-III synthase [Gammaproteobacteria bacterium]
MTPPPNVDDSAPLAGRTVAVPEARHADVLASLLEKRGARIVRCPLVAIRDTDDEPAVAAWIERAIATPPSVLVLYTGEGVDRLTAFAERAGRKDAFVAALGQTRTLTRGPKPRRALNRLGIAPTVEAPEPTTAGILAALDRMEIDDGRVAVQLYGTEPNRALLDYLARRGLAADCVAPYTYASAADDDQVAELIGRMRRGEVDAIAFTSKSQLDRLRRLAGERGLVPDLEQALAATRVAAVGPVVAAELSAAGIRVDAVPTESFHMKPLADALAALFSRAKG